MALRENLYTPEHRYGNDKYRKEYDRIFQKDDKNEIKNIDNSDNKEK